MRQAQLPQRRFVHSGRKLANGDTAWVRAGSAWVRDDGAVEVFLDVLPLDGRLVITADEQPPRRGTNMIDPRAVGL